MLLITKALAEAVVKAHNDENGVYCAHCDAWYANDGELQHQPDCIVLTAKLLLKREWGIE